MLHWNYENLNRQKKEKALLAPFGIPGKHLQIVKEGFVTCEACGKSSESKNENITLLYKLFSLKTSEELELGIDCTNDFLDLSSDETQKEFAIKNKAIKYYLYLLEIKKQLKNISRVFKNKASATIEIKVLNQKYKIALQSLNVYNNDEIFKITFKNTNLKKINLEIHKRLMYNSTTYYYTVSFGYWDDGLSKKFESYLQDKISKTYTNLGSEILLSVFEFLITINKPDSIEGLD